MVRKRYYLVNESTGEYWFPFYSKGAALAHRRGLRPGRYRVMTAQGFNTRRTRKLRKSHAANPHRALTGSWSSVSVRRLKNGKVQLRIPLRKRNPNIIDAISPGDRVTIVDRFGKERTGRAVIVTRGSHVTLNMGGPYGTPAVATPENIVRVSKSKTRGGGFVFR